MRTLLGTLLGVIAIGVLLIAYGLLSPRASAAGSYQLAGPVMTGDRMGLASDVSTAATPQLLLRCETGQRAVIRQVAGAAAAECVDDGQGSTRTAAVAQMRDVRPARIIEDVRPVRVSEEAYSAPRPAPVRIERSRERDWVKTAMLIGGSSAAGAGIGGIFNGKRGALIGAAIGGGAGTLYEVNKR